MNGPILTILDETHVLVEPDYCRTCPRKPDNDEAVVGGCCLDPEETTVNDQIAVYGSAAELADAVETEATEKTYVVYNRADRRRVARASRTFRRGEARHRDQTERPTGLSS